jgi:hypothetical protein
MALMLISLSAATAANSGTPLRQASSDGSSGGGAPSFDYGGLIKPLKKISPVPSSGRGGHIYDSANSYDGNVNTYLAPAYTSHTPSLSASSGIGLVGSNSHPNDIIASMRNSGVILPTIGK